ncbi:glycosyltransferase family 2 protein [Salinicola halophilus]|uniref:glycosyltransferase family 2 protein n=1 Tax=Salinicola halophilus TaxID=184065 RepID=UPI0019550AC5|nr:galactosyltransferase-related protein [Salinicola halophilus]
MKVSVLTLVRGRRDALINLMRSLAAQHYPPDELVIAWMQPAPEPDLPETPFPVRHVIVEGEALPLARARNAAVAAARFEALVFLDVDCIASPPLVGRYRDALARGPAIYLGEVHYLPANALPANALPANALSTNAGRDRRDGPLDWARLAALGERHPARPAIADDEIRFDPDHGNLWGLSFALYREDHRRVGGMDEGYVGYGGEETDYAWRLAAAEVPLYWVGGALAWHQHHPVYAPPWPHFEAIIANARRFHRRWGRWCMAYWLGQFRDAGAIAWDERAATLEILRYPSAAETAAARLPASARYG